MTGQHFPDLQYDGIPITSSTMDPLLIIVIWIQGNAYLWLLILRCIGLKWPTGF